VKQFYFVNLWALLCNLLNKVELNFSWSKTPAKERAKIMMKIADVIEARLQEFAKAESKDQGKPVWLAELVDIPRVLLNMRSFAVAIQNHVSRWVIFSFILPVRGLCGRVFWCCTHSDPLQEILGLQMMVDL
jgi:hypothetical protein